MSPEQDAPVIGYARVSTDEQENDGASLAAQRHAITQECARRGWRLVEVYEDTGSGKSYTRRTGLLSALGRLESRDHDRPRAIVVARLDRLTRSVADGGRLFERAASGKWGIVALDLGVDTTTPAGELVANVMVAVGQWERRVISERTSAALRQRQREGEHVGRPAQISYANDDDPAKRRAAVLAAERMERVVALRESGLSWRKVAAALNAEGTPGLRGGRWTDMSARLAYLRHGPKPEPQAEAAG